MLQIVKKTTLRRSIKTLDQKIAQRAKMQQVRQFCNAQQKQEYLPYKALLSWKLHGFNNLTVGTLKRKHLGAATEITVRYILLSDVLGFGLAST